MPPNETGFMSTTVTGQELLNGNGLVFEFRDSAPTDTTGAHGQAVAVVSGATIVLYILDRTNGVWRSRSFT